MKFKDHSVLGWNQCTDCKDPKAIFKETTQHDDMDGVLHCTKCNKQIKRYSVFMDDAKTLAYNTSKPRRNKI